MSAITRIVMGIMCAALVGALPLTANAAAPDRPQSAIDPMETSGILLQPAANHGLTNDNSRSTVPRSLKPVMRRAKYAKGRFILKFKETFTEPADLLFEQGIRFDSATPAKNGKLDELNSAYHVQSVKPLFHQFAPPSKGTLSGKTLRDQRKRVFSDRMDEIKKRFPHRTKRASGISAPPDLTHIYVVTVPADTDIKTLCAQYAQDPNVAYCQPDNLAQAQWVPNDPYYFSYGTWGQPYDDLWNLKKIGAEQAWDLSSGQGTVVAVVDTGIDYNHADIAANIWTNPGEIANNGIDDDGNGYVDDVRGWDFVGADANNPHPDKDPMDGFGHGTHVAGTIAAVGNNGIGVIGVAYQAQVMAVKGLDDQGYGSLSNLAEAIVYAASNGADVINNSWGCACAADPLVQDAVATANGLGAVVVFAAGNSNIDVKDFFPANLQDVLTVASSDANDAKSSFSNWGYQIDVAAPGGGPDSGTADYAPQRNILSLKAQNGDPGLEDPGLIVGTDYLRQAGTSMAAPHVSGVAALLLSRNPALSRDEVMSIIKHTADDQVGDPSMDTPGFDLYSGWGRLNAASAVQNAFTPPPDPPLIATDPPVVSFELPSSPCSGNSATIGIFNIGADVLNWSASAPSWLTLDTASGTTPSTMNATVIDTTADQSGVIHFLSSEAANSPFDLTVSSHLNPSVTMTNCNIILSDADGNQHWQPVPLDSTSPPAISDGAGGAIYVWGDTRNGYSDLYMQRLDGAGNAMWTANGLQLAGAQGVDRAERPSLISDGAGGAIVVWEEGPSDISATNLKAQRVDASGQLLWAAGGVSISAAPDAQLRPSIISDGNGGAFIAWVDNRNAGETSVYAQHIDGSGTPLWAIDGIPVDAKTTGFYAITSDGAGGMIIAWASTPDQGEYVTYVQRFDADGHALWGPGVPLSLQHRLLFDVQGVNIVPDGAGGAIIVWDDNRNGFVDNTLLPGFDIYGEHVDATGQALWGPTSGGIPITTGLTASGGAFDPNFQPSLVLMVSDGQGGAIISWLDNRLGRWDLYAQRIDANGGSLWTPNGTPVVAAPGTRTEPALLSDGQHGAILAWNDWQSLNDPSLYIQHLDATGQRQWGENGILAQGARGYQLYPYLVSLNAHAFVLSWDDLLQCPNYTYCSGMDNLLGRSFQFTDATLVPPQTPTAVTYPSVLISQNATTLKGGANPDGTSTMTWFEWGTTAAYGQVTPAQSAGNGTVAVAFSDMISGLSPNTNYHYRAVAQNSFGTTYGGDMSVISLAEPPVVDTSDFPTVTATDATLWGGINPNGVPATAWFEFGTDTSYGQTLAVQTFTGDIPITFSTPITGLTPGTTYHYRTVGKNNGGVSYGADVSFATGPDLIMTRVTPNAATMNPGGTLSVTTSAMNQGGLSAGSSTIAFRLSTNAIYGDADDIAVTQTRAVGTLAAGIASTAATTLSIPSTIVAGAYYVCAAADATNTVDEGNNEGNNTRCSDSPVDVLPPNLIMINLSTTSTDLPPGTTFKLANTAVNSGNVSATAFTIAFHLSADAVFGGSDDIAMTATRSVSSLSGGAGNIATTTLTVPASTPAGSYFICAFADSGDAVSESDENDNGACTSSSLPVAYNPPAVNSVSLASVTYGITTSRAITISGANFVLGSTITAGGLSGTTVTGTAATAANPFVYVSSTKLSFWWDQTSLAPAAYDVTVALPTWAGGLTTTLPASFTVIAPQPTVSSLSPSSATYGITASRSISISGSNFIFGGTITVQGPGGTLSGTMDWTASTATAAHPFVFYTKSAVRFWWPNTALTPGSYDITVTNPAVAGGSSATKVGGFVVIAPQPTVSSLSPSSVTYGVTASRSISISGSNFVLGGTITVEGPGGTLSGTMDWTATTATAEQPFIFRTKSNVRFWWPNTSLLPGSYNVTVTNPPDAGGKSATKTGGFIVH